MTKQNIIDIVSNATGLTKVETEAVMNGVMKTIIDLKKTHTIIMISHNSELVKLCDKKIYISSKKAIITK